MARAMPKSMTLGPSAVIMMLDGLRSRWTTSEAWSWASAVHSRAPIARTAGSGSGPATETAWSRDGPSTYSVASQGVSASGSASKTRAPWTGPMTRAASTSRRKRVRPAGSAATWACIVFSAAVRPVAERAR